ncbi:MAG: 3-deoxy-D-manno-octulosonic acid transferase [Bacteroidia bacterium]|nr:3-deoxy-D-manno-octulosonic acid transferase [Bacteroidia bacterium]
MRNIYTLFILAYYTIIRVIALFNTKAKLFVLGRKNVWAQLANFKPNGTETYWFHCASLGEFEQARPIIEALKLKNKLTQVVVTFFSPSGYEVRKNYPLADVVCYLPMDTLHNATQFITAIQPTKVFFIKYEFWFNYIHILHTRNIPTYYVCALFRPNQYFFKWYGKWFANQLKHITNYFTQNTQTAELLTTIGIAQHTVVGDTRYDRVQSIAAQAQPIAIVNQFAQGKKLLVIGSSWSVDEAMWLHIYKNNAELQHNYKLIFAPHNVTTANVDALLELFSNYKVSKYSSYNAGIESNVLIIDNVGMLSSLYSMAHIAYIGGGFGKAVHNTLEAAVYGIPVVFGPKHAKFYEIQELLATHSAVSVTTANELELTVLKLITDVNYYTQLCINAKTFVSQRTGATQAILHSTN